LLDIKTHHFKRCSNWSEPFNSSKFSFLNKKHYVMKKIKMFLTGTAMLVVVGAGLAMKSHNFTGGLFCDSKPGSQGGNCSTTAIRYIQSGTTSLSLYCHVGAGTCPETKTNNLVQSN
jgi:hypothetical protein